MVSFELIAILVVIIGAVKAGAERASCAILSDSKSGVAAIKKSFSMKEGVASLVAAITRALGPSADIRIGHIAGKTNWLADRLFRDNTFCPERLTEAAVTVEELIQHMP